jgi:hypothetical protein
VRDGHRTRSVFDRYNITDEADLIDASVKIEQFLVQAIKEEKVVRLQK